MKAFDLLHVLQNVLPGLAKKEIVEQSTCFLFQSGKVTAFNDEIYATHPLPAEISDLEGAIQGEKLYSLLSKVSSKDIEITSKKNEIRLKGKGFSSGIKRQSVERKPEVPIPDKSQKAKEGLRQAIKTCLFSAGKDPTRPLLTCIHVAPDKVESSDLYRYTRFIIDTGLKKSVLVPAIYAKHLVSYGEIKTIAASKGWLHFTFTENDTLFSCRTYGEEYPQTDHLVSKQGDKITLPKTITTAVERASIFLDQNYVSEQNIQLTTSRNRITVRGEDIHGWAETTSKIDFEGEDFSVAINAGMFSEIIKHTRTALVTDRTLQFQTNNFLHLVIVMNMNQE